MAERVMVRCRPARAEDEAEVAALTRTIWNGEDYVPQAWAGWLADPEGVLAVAEWPGEAPTGRRVVGLGKLSRLGPQDWWLEGLRTDPELEGRGIAGQVFAYLAAAWERQGSGALRLATASTRYPVQHLAEKTGMRKVGEFIPHKAAALAEPASRFWPAAPDEVERALAVVRQAETLTAAGGLLDTGYAWTPPNAQRLARSIADGQAWWWGEPGPAPEGLLLGSAFHEKPDQPLDWTIWTAAGPFERLAALLLDARRLAAGQGFAQATWFAPAHPQVAAALAAAGYARSWDQAIYVYAKRMPAADRLFVKPGPI